MSEQRHVDTIAALLTIAVWAGDLGQDLDENTVFTTWQDMRNRVSNVLAIETEP